MTSNRIFFQAAGKDAVDFILCDGRMCASMWGISEAHSLAHERSSASVTKKILKLRRKLTEMGEKENEREEFIHAIRKFMEMRTLTKQVLNELFPEGYNADDDSFEESETEQA